MSGAQLGYNWSLTPLDYEPRDNTQIARKHIKMQMFCVLASSLWATTENIWEAERKFIEAAPDKIICCYRIIKRLLCIPRLNYKRNTVIPKCFIRIASWGSWCNCIIHFSEGCSCRLNRGANRDSAKDVSGVCRNLPSRWQICLV